DGEIAIRERRMQDAMLAVDQAVRLEPMSADRHIQRARCYVIAGNTDEARVSALAALNYDIRRLDHQLILGGVLVRCDEHAKALALYRSAVKQAPDNADVHRGLASVYRFLGQLDDAGTACDRAIRIDSHDYEMIGLRSSLKAQSKDKNHIDELLALEKAGVKNWRGLVHVCYALGKEYEDIGEYASSFAWLQRGASAKRENTRYDVHDDVKIFSSLKSAFSQNRIDGFDGGGDSSKDPIFVLGMPRTGSTLVERIISSHSMVQNCGELSTFSVEMMNLVEKQGQPLGDRLELAERAARIPLESMGESYLQGLAPIRDGSPRFVDKLPMNSLNIGLIHGALPNAKIVHVVRNPMDACYAMYKFLFKNGYPFSYNLQDLATYYAEYYHLMEHWRGVLPANQIYDIRYEQVVGDLPGEAQRLIEFLELPWEKG
ncbi:MAG: sulfotransferase, partial [Woeseiales bacterium]